MYVVVCVLVHIFIFNYHLLKSCAMIKILFWKGLFCNVLILIFALLKVTDWDILLIRIL